MLVVDLNLRLLLVMVVRVHQEQLHMLVPETDLKQLLWLEIMELSLLVVAEEEVD